MLARYSAVENPTEDHRGDYRATLPITISQQIMASVIDGMQWKQTSTEFFLGVVGVDAIFVASA